jgi:enoyl-CoA hydratase
MVASDNSESAVVLDWPIPEVARITLDRGDELNTLTYEIIEGLDRAIEQARESAARVAVVTGSGRAFCSGAHVKYFTDPASPLHDNAAAIRDGYVQKLLGTFRKFQDMPFATIAAINGFAFGGGCELALSCDFRLMAADARIGLTEVRLGAMPGGGGVQLLSKLIGRAGALEMILLGDQWSAEEARAAGLVTAVHPAGDLADEALVLARRLLACSPISISEAKRAVFRCEAADVDEADKIALDAVAFVASGRDWREGMAAFAERRLPDFAANGKPRGK